MRGAKYISLASLAAASVDDRKNAIRRDELYNFYVMFREKVENADGFRLTDRAAVSAGPLYAV